MSAKQLPGGVIRFSGEIVFRHDDPPKPVADEKVAVLSALSILTKTELLQNASPYMVGKLKARLKDFNIHTHRWRVKGAKDVSQ